MYQENKTAGRVDGEWLAGANDRKDSKILAKKGLLTTSPEPLSQVNNGEKPKYYKPFVLWTSTLSFLLGVTIILIAITELACQRLPNAENRGIVGNLNNRTGIMSKLIPRQNPSTDGPQVSIIQAPAPAITPPPTQADPASPEYRVTTEVTK